MTSLRGVLGSCMQARARRVMPGGVLLAAMAGCVVAPAPHTRTHVHAHTHTHRRIGSRATPPHSVSSHSRHCPAQASVQDGLPAGTAIAQPAPAEPPTPKRRTAPVPPSTATRPPCLTAMAPHGQDAPNDGCLPRFTLRDVKQHRFHDDAWAAVDGRVLDITQFIGAHPGGDVIALAAGIDATILFRTYHPNGVPAAVVDRLTIGRLATESAAGAAAAVETTTTATPSPQPPSSSYYTWDESPFYSVLQQRVVARLRALRRPRRGGTEIWAKAAALLAVFWGALWVMIFGSTGAPGQYWSRAVPACVVMGLAASFIGTCVQHDGNHGAFAAAGWLNKLSGWTLDMIGASAFTWEIQHVLGHHPYTNLLDVGAEKAKQQQRQPQGKQQQQQGERGKGGGTDNDCSSSSGGGGGGGGNNGSAAHANHQESDPDVFSSFPLMRMHPAHPRLWYHRYQHLYAPFLFALMTLAKVFQQDVEMFQTGRLYHLSADCRYGHSRVNAVRFVGMKLLSLVYMVVLPCAAHGVLRGCLLFLIGHLVCGEMLATMFIVNHVIEGVAFARRTAGASGVPAFAPPATVDGVRPMARQQATRIAAADTRLASSLTRAAVPPNDWAAVQCQTSVNWAPGSWFWNHFSGGLNHQIEHHLFPSVCHPNYVHIQPVVEATCREFGVPYRCEPSLPAAYRKMIAHLRRMGQPDSRARTCWDVGL